MTIFEKLREDHEAQRKLVDELVESSGASEQRREIYKKLKLELAAHAKAEERCLYAPMLNVDITQEKARHSIAEHHEMDEYIEELEDADMSSPHWISVAKKLRHRLYHHLEEEEHEIFQMAGKVLSPAVKKQLAEEFQLITGVEKGKITVDG